MNALVYLTVLGFKNSLRRVVKTPRLLLPGIALLLIFGSQLALFYASPQRGTVGALPAFTPTELIVGGPGALVAAVKGILLLSIFTAAINALGEGGLFFTASDVDFLFPAPLARRGVLFFKMIGRYFVLLFPAAYLPLVAGGMAVSSSVRLSPVAYWPGTLGCWLFLIAIANFAQTVLLARAPDDTEAGEERAKRRERIRKSVTFVAVALVIGGLYLLLRGDSARQAHSLLRLVNSGVGRTALLPVTWAAELFYVPFNGWNGAQYAHLAGLLVLTAFSFVLLFSRDRDFYESAQAISGKRTQMRQAVQSGDAGAILSQMAQEGKLARGRAITPFGGGAKAVLWRDMVATTRTPLRSWVTLLVLAALPALLSTFFGSRQGAASILFWIVIFTLQMSGLFLLSLRDMLRRADISKALPIAPARFLLAELTLSITQLTVLGWFSLGVMAAMGSGRGGGPMALVAALSLPSLAALLLLVQTSFVLLYPNPADPAQNAISGILSVIACLISLAPAVLVGVTLWLNGASPLVLAAGVTGANVIGAAAALCLAAFLWQRFDPTD